MELTIDINTDDDRRLSNEHQSTYESKNELK